LSNDGLNNIGIKFIDTLKTPNGLKFKTTLKRDPNGNLTGTLEPEIKFSSKNITFEGKISTDNKYEDSVSFTNYLVDGSKFSLKGLYEEGSMNGEAGLEFKNENVAFNASLSYPDSGDIKVAAAAVYNSSGYSLGGDAEYVMSSALNKWSIKVQRDTEENSFCFFSNHVLVPKKKNLLNLILDLDTPKMLEVDLKVVLTSKLIVILILILDLDQIMRLMKPVT